jgi:CRP/FNR family cyclic AMP-dependent transcriptional regulator
MRKKEFMMGEKSLLFEYFGRTMKAGDIVCKEGDHGDTMYIIQQGKVKITKHIAGKEHILAVLEKGDFFGEMALVTRVKRTATVTTLTTVEVLEFDRSGFIDLIKKNAQIALNIIDKLCRRLHNANLKLQHLVPRYDKALVALSLYYSYKGQEEEPDMLEFDNLLEEISMDLDLPKQRVTELINEFEKQGIIKIESDKIILCNEKKLYAITERI